MTKIKIFNDIRIIDLLVVVILFLLAFYLYGLSIHQKVMEKTGKDTLDLLKSIQNETIEVYY